MWSRLFLFFLIFFQHVSLAQNTLVYTHDNALFRTGLELFDKEKYSAARHYFERYLALNKNDLLSVEAEYYLADCGLLLFHSDAESKLQDFIKKYPEHPLSQQALLSLANIHKAKKEYKKAIEYYQRINPALLQKDQVDEANFHTGYCYLNDKDLDKALPYFNGLKNSENKFTYASSYYAGNIEFKQGNYDASLADFKKAQKNESYKPLVPYMVVNILYRQKKYDELIAYTDTLGNGKTDYKNLEGVHLIMADVFFRKQEFLKSIQYTEKYSALGKELPEDAQFRYAKAFYYIGKNAKAIENFKKLSGHQDSLGQHSTYFLALSYLRDENQAFAAPLLFQSANMTYVPEVQEESLFLYGKVSYEMGKFAEVISSLKSYRKKHPKGRFSQEANEILSDALLNTSNYAEALSYIESLPKRSNRIDAVYQKVAYQRAEELYNQNVPDSSFVYFEKSLEFPYDKVLVSGAYYWSAEIMSAKREYKEAVDYYLKSQEVKQASSQDFYKKADFGMAYAFFNQKMYDKAAIRFKQYTDHKDQQSDKYYADALLRLADCYYTQKKYTEALATYENALNSHNKENDYILLQKGLIQGIMGNYEQADNLLFALTHNYPKSPYYEVALFNKTLFAVEKGDYKTAIEGFTMIIRERPGSTYVPYALERRAICNINLKNTDLAYQDYQTVLKEYPNSPVANAALQGIQEIMSKEGKNEEFLSVLEEFKTANPQKSDLETIEYESGKRLYFDQKYNEAIKTLSKFLTSYPNSIFAYDANYYLADADYRMGKFSDALPFYQKVVDMNKGTYTNRAVYKMAEIQYSFGQYQDAMKYYKQLQTLASSKKEIANAYQGMMLSYYQIASYDSSFAYANAIIQSGYATTPGQNKAYLYLGKSTLAKKDTSKALDYFVSTLNEAQDEQGAEAQYTIASIFYAQKKYKSSLNELFNLNEQYSDYTKWVGQSFLLVSDNYLALNETFQAKATLESLVKNFPEPDIVEMAKQKLEKLKQEEKEGSQ